MSSATDRADEPGRALPPEVKRPFDSKEMDPAAGGRAGRLSFGQKAAWGMGGFAENIMSNAFPALALPIYNIGLGIDAVWLGWAMFLPRVIDAMIDPLLGNLSDNTRSRWGRRRPSIFIGAVLCGLFMAAIWSPPLEWGKGAILSFFWFTSIAYYISFVVFWISYNALGLELTDDYHERTRVCAWRFFFISASGLLVSWMYKLSLLPVFSGAGPFPNHHREVIGIRWVGVLFGVIVLSTGSIPSIFSRERIAAREQPRINLLRACKITFTNRVYLIFISFIMVSLFGLFLVTPFSFYIILYHVCGGDNELAGKLTGWCGVFNTLLGFVSIPMVTALATRLGKRRAIFVGQLLILCGCFASWLVYTPRFPLLVVLTPLCLTPGLTAIFILQGSMLAEVCDLDELHSGLRREGCMVPHRHLLGKWRSRRQRSSAATCSAGRNSIRLLMFKRRIRFIVYAFYLF